MLLSIRNMVHIRGRDNADAGREQEGAFEMGRRKGRGQPSWLLLNTAPRNLMTTDVLSWSSCVACQNLSEEINHVNVDFNDNNF